MGNSVFNVFLSCTDLQFENFTETQKYSSFNLVGSFTLTVDIYCNKPLMITFVIQDFWKKQYFLNVWYACLQANYATQYLFTF